MYPVAQLLRDKPLVLHVHGSFGEATSDPSLDRTIQYRLYDAVFKRIATNAAAVVVSSRQEHREAVEFGVPEERIHTIPVGKDPETYTAVPFSPPTDRCRVLFVGRLAPRRNVEMLIEAVATLDRDDVELRIVGGEGTLSGAEESNYLDRLERTVTEFDAGDRVTFTGPQYGDDLVREFRSADVFANPTHYENFGQATLEAAFAGLPLVATPTGVAPELIEGEDTGRLVETATEMRAAIDELADAPDRRRELGQHAQTLAREEYRWDRIVDQYESLYRSVLGM
jgi:glycosyltransferase involved in cell wall biosynthesis